MKKKPVAGTEVHVSLIGTELGITGPFKQRGTVVDIPEHPLDEGHVWVRFTPDTAHAFHISGMQRVRKTKVYKDEHGKT